MRFIIAKIRQYIFPLLLILIALLIIIKSYTPGTILSGWDTLHPEFDFGLYFKRIFTVWQSHQGLGAPPSQSHIGDLPHAFILWIMSFFLSMNLLRYAFILSMLVLGPLGVYYFLKDHIFEGNKKLHIFAFIGGFFYLLNLGTLQNFYTPLEMFTTFYGLLGWLLWAIVRFLKNGNKINLSIITFITIVFASTSHTATLWYIFYGSLGLFLVTNLIINKFQRDLLRKSIFLFVLIFLLNAFWIFPNLYYAKNYSKDVSLSKINRMGSNEFFFRGQKRGTINDLALITNFPFDWKVYDFDKNSPAPQLDQWKEHVQTPFVQIWGAILFVLFLIGIVQSFRKKNYLLMAFVPVFILCLFFLRNANFPLTSFFLFLRDKFPFFSEMLRFPFTKFSILYMFLYSIFLAYALYNLINFLSKITPKNIYIHLFTVFFIGQVFFMLPVLETGYISRTMKVKIPQNYFELFTNLKHSPKERILTLPLHNFAGWQYNSWGYQGAGFIWFGLKQPVLNRDFDRWYPYNEQAYREFSYALYSQNIDLFSKLLQKYRVGYVLMDESIIDTDSKYSRQIIFNRESKDLLQQIPFVTKNWSSNFLSLYKIDLKQEELELINNLPSIYPSYRFTTIDEAYNNFGDYINTNDNTDIYYPFRSFLNETDKLSQNIAFNLDDYYYQANMGKVPDGKRVIPLKSEDNFASQGGSINFSLTSVYGKISKQGFVINPTDIEKIPVEEDYNWKKQTTPEKIHYESTDKIIGSYYDLSSLSENQGYAISFRSKNIAGLPLRFCIKSIYSHKCEIYDELSKNKSWGEDFFILPPLNQGLGYSLDINNVSVGNIPTINELSWIKIAPLPYSFLTGIRIEKPGFESKIKQKIALNFKDSGFKKIVDLPLNIPDRATLILNQAYEKNWKAYYIDKDNFLTKYFPFIFGSELEHVKINNWANGWRLRPEQIGTSATQGANVTIIFWPQYLGFLGFALLTITFIYLIFFFYNHIITIQRVDFITRKSVF